jgi:hypothetical protein
MPYAAIFGRLVMGWSDFFCAIGLLRALFSRN